MTSRIEHRVAADGRPELARRLARPIVRATAALAVSLVAASVAHPVIEAAGRWLASLAAAYPVMQAPVPWEGNGAAAATASSTPLTIDPPSNRAVTLVRPLSCEKLADIPGKSVTTALVAFPPGAYSPAHRHPGSVTAFVVRGSIRSQLAGTPPRIYRPGNTWFEPAGTLHVFAENASDVDSAELLAVFVTDDDCGPLVIPEASHGPNESPGERR